MCNYHMDRVGSCTSDSWNSWMNIPTVCTHMQLHAVICSPSGRVVPIFTLFVINKNGNVFERVQSSACLRRAAYSPKWYGICGFLCCSVLKCFDDVRL